MASLQPRSTYENEAYRLSNKRHADRAREQGWEHWVGDWPVVPQLALLFKCVSPHVMNNLKIVLFQRGSERTTSSTGEVVFVANEFSVYMGDCPFDVCRVGFANYGANNKSSYMYGVYSRKIKNSKYRPNREQFNMVMCRDAEKAAKNFMTYLIPMTHAELAKAYYPDMRGEVSHARDRFRSDYASALYDMMGTTGAEIAGEEFILLAKQGVKFNNPRIQSNIGAATAAFDAYREDATRVVTATFVRFREMDGAQFVEVVDTDVIGNSSANGALNGAVSKLYTMAELPQEVAERVAVLTILEDKQYVSKVGLRLNETTFWIERG